jgi:hypothetical protein
MCWRGMGAHRLFLVPHSSQRPLAPSRRGILPLLSQWIQANTLLVTCPEKGGPRDAT